MITFRELMGSHVISEIPVAHQHNLEELLKRMNKIRDQWGKPMRITSGYRSLQEHLRIYHDIAQKKGVSFDRSKVPMMSKHLYGQAVDIADPDGQLKQFLKTHEHILMECELWCEEGTVGWVHFQIIPPVSKKRWFLP